MLVVCAAKKVARVKSQYIDYAVHISRLRGSFHNVQLTATKLLRKVYRTSS